MSQVELERRPLDFGAPEAQSGDSSGQQQPPQEQVRQVELYGERIVALIINGRERLCLAQISNGLLRQFSYNEIHNRRVALGITCVQCTPIQLELLRRAGAMPSSSRRCGMITMREAQRLCKSFLFDEQAPELPENFYFSVAHRINYGCRGRFVPARYISSRAKCIECFYCGEFFSPNKFIFHSHRQPEAGANECNPPDSPNINSWRKHIDLDPNAPGGANIGQDIKYAWEDVKSLFNGGTRRRAPGGPATGGSAHNWTSSSSSRANSATTTTTMNNATSHRPPQLVNVDTGSASDDASDLDLEVDGAQEVAREPQEPVTTKPPRNLVAQKRRHPSSHHHHNNMRASGDQSVAPIKRPAQAPPPLPPPRQLTNYGHAQAMLNQPAVNPIHLVGFCQPGLKSSVASSQLPLKLEPSTVGSLSLGQAALNNLYPQQQLHNQHQHDQGQPNIQYNNPIYSHLAHQQQQQQQQQQQLPLNTSLEAQLALTRHQFWTNLLVNLQQQQQNQQRQQQQMQLHQAYNSVPSLGSLSSASIETNSSPISSHLTPSSFVGPNIAQFNPQTSCSSATIALPPTTVFEQDQRDQTKASHLHNHNHQHNLNNPIDTPNQLGQLLNASQLYTGQMSLASKLQLVSRHQQSLRPHAVSSNTSLNLVSGQPSTATTTTSGGLQQEPLGQLDSSCSSTSRSSSPLSSPSSSSSLSQLPISMACPTGPFNGHKFAGSDQKTPTPGSRDSQQFD